jgi:hypothetical protein
MGDGEHSSVRYPLSSAALCVRLISNPLITRNMASTCKHGRVNPSGVTKNRLFADSGGYCAKPDCLTEIFRDFSGEAIHIGEIAHIISAGNEGPRADTALSDLERSRYENLILLCPTCHTIIDKAEDQFPTQMILGWKRSHKEKLAAAFNIKMFDTRADARAAVIPLLRENKYVFDRYGPHTDERFNPESSLPAQWRIKIRTVIIPNNRKILNIVEANSKFLNDEEFDAVENFRQHVKDFEAKHLDNSQYNGLQFPVQFDKIFE